MCHLLKHRYVLFIVQNASYIPLALLMQINARDVSMALYMPYSLLSSLLVQLAGMH